MADDELDERDDAVEPDSLEASLGLTLRWRAAVVPPEVEAPRVGDAADDPAADPLPSADPAWDAAVALLAVDPEFQRRRALVDDVALHVVVREADEATLAAFPEDAPTTAVVMVVPVADHLGDDAVPLPLEERVQAHLDALVTLVVETQAALGRD